MKVLWITNVLLPDAERFITGVMNTAGSGGWLYSSAKMIKNEVDLYVATPTNKVKELTQKKIDNITYFLFPIGDGNIKYNKSYEAIWEEIRKRVVPDLVHLHGTEFSHGLAYINACGCKNVVVSIQGVMTEIAKHRNDGLTKREILRNITLYDLIKGTLFSQKKEAVVRSYSELKILEKVQYVIGRTTFDHAYALSLNPQVQYYHCNESLREEFYSGEWKYEECMPHTIYISSAAYPLKGLHMLLHAMPLILQKYKDTKIVVAGRNIKRRKGLQVMIKYCYL